MSLQKQLRPSDNSPSQEIQFRDLHLQHWLLQTSLISNVFFFVLAIIS